MCLGKHYGLVKSTTCGILPLQQQQLPCHRVRLAHGQELGMLRFTNCTDICKWQVLVKEE